MLAMETRTANVKQRRDAIKSANDLAAAAREKEKGRVEQRNEKMQAAREAFEAKIEEE